MGKYRVTFSYMGHMPIKSTVTVEVYADHAIDAIHRANDLFTNPSETLSVDKVSS